MLINRKMKIFAIFLTFLMLFINYIICKPLTQSVLEYLDKDEEIYLNYRKQYKYLSCKLLTYSKMKLYYEQEVIDAYMNQTTLKKEFLDYFQDKLM